MNVAGEDHVGLGTDGGVSGIESDPRIHQAAPRERQERRRQGISAPGEEEDVYTFLPDLNTPRRFETLAAMLRERGHSQARIEKILGGNFARLFREVWPAA